MEDPEFEYYDDEDYELKVGPIETIRKKSRELTELRRHFAKQLKTNPELYTQLIYSIDAKTYRLDYIISVRLAIESLSQQQKK